MNLVITPVAEKFIRRMIRFGNLPAGGGLRLAVTPGGCSGVVADFEAVAEPRAGDFALEHNGLRLFLPAESRLLLDGVTIDFAETVTEWGLVFRDPKSNGSTCGAASPAGSQLISLAPPRRKAE